VSKRARRESFAAAYPLRVLGWTVAAMIAATVLAFSAFDRQSDPLCATRAQRELIRSELTRNPGVWLVDLAHDIHVSEAVVLDAIPDAVRAGVRGSELSKVWDWLRRQPDLVVSLHNGRHTWRVRGALPALRQTGLGNWHIGGEDDILSARISTLDVGVIYARLARLPDEPAWAVHFLARDGEIVFQISPATPSELDTGSESRTAQSLLQAFRALESVCRHPPKNVR
jgi:putative heme iron utilization protein